MEKKENSCCAPSCCSTDETTLTETFDTNDHVAIKNSVREKYATIALQKNPAGCCSSEQKLEVSFVGDSYDNVDGHIADADLGLG